MSKPSHEFNTHRPIKSREELIAWLKSGEQACGKIGVEYECFLVDEKTQAPASYDQIKAFLTALKKTDAWRGVYEDHKLIGLEHQLNGSNWSIEPGGQIEYGDAPRDNVNDLSEALDKSFYNAEQAAAHVGCAIVGMGFHPVKDGAHLPLMPKSRAHEMREYMKDRKKYPYVDDIMRATCAVQVNLGFSSEDDFIKKVRIGLALQPVVTALFANSPFHKGKPSGYQSTRAARLKNSFGGRLGYMLPIAFDRDFGYQKFVDYACDKIAMVGFYKRSEFTAIETKVTFAEFIKGDPHIKDGQKATMADWVNHVNTIWPEVRIRKHLEMRGADCNSPAMMKALAALWTGLLYDTEARDQAYALIKDWSQEERERLHQSAPIKGLKADFRDHTILELAQKIVTIAEEGLKRRDMKEEFFLYPLKDILASKLSPADRMIAEYHTEWHGDANCAFAFNKITSPPCVRIHIEAQKLCKPLNPKKK